MQTVFPWLFLLFFQSDPSRPVARIGDVVITEAELESRAQSQLRQLRNQEHEIRSRTLDNLIAQRLVELEAARRGVPPDKLLFEEADSKVGEPTDAEINAFYLAQRDRIGRPLDQVRPQVIQALKQAKGSQAREAFVKKLRDSQNVAVLMEPPRIRVSPDPKRIKGNSAAPVQIVEFSDFECPYCQRSQAALKQVLEKYGNRVSLSFRDFPLTQIHSKAQGAAEAARCAGEQGRFWEYHDRLFAGADLEQAGLLQVAKELGLDPAAFNGCLASGKFRQSIDSDVQEGTRVGVNGTPAFFINGVLLSGMQSLDDLVKVIDAELSRVGK